MATPSSAKHLHRRGEELDVDALLERAFDFGLDGRHFGARAAVQDRDLGAQPLADAGRIDGGIAAADHQHLATHLHLLAAVDAVQKFRPGEDVRRILAGNPQLQALVSADAHEHRLVLAAQTSSSETSVPIAALHSQLHAEIENALDLGIQHFAGQAVLRECRSAACRPAG